MNSNGRIRATRMPHSTGTAAIPAPGAAPLDTIAARSLGVNGFPSLAARRLSLTRGTAQRSPCLTRPACGEREQRLRTQQRRPAKGTVRQSLGMRALSHFEQGGLYFIVGTGQRWKSPTGPAEGGGDPDCDEEEVK